MPTFDFFNVVRKVVSTAITVAASPVTAVLACSALLATFLDDILAFFTTDFKLPDFQLLSLNLPDGADQFRDILLYAVDFETCLDIVNFVLGFVSSLISFGIRYLSSFLLVVVTYGAYRVVRSKLKDFAG